MRRSFLILLVSSFLLITCQSFEKENIHEVLNRREEALRKRDLPLYLSCISRAYQDKDEDFSRLQNRIDGYFKNFDQIEYASWDRSMQIEGRTAKVIQQFHLGVRKGGKKNRYSGKEAIFLEKEGKTWKIIKGL